MRKFFKTIDEVFAVDRRDPASRYGFYLFLGIPFVILPMAQVQERGTVMLVIPALFLGWALLSVLRDFPTSKVPMPLLSSDPLPESDDVLDFRLERYSASPYRRRGSRSEESSPPSP